MALMRSGSMMLDAYLVFGVWSISHPPAYVSLLSLAGEGERQGN